MILEALYFPLHDYWLFYVVFTLFVLMMLALDLGVFHKESHAVSFKEALFWTIFWISLALLFNLGFYYYSEWKFSNDVRLLAIPGFIPEKAAYQSALEFITGYVVEKSLSVDNIFVFVVVFSYFGIPAKYQHRVLFFGIIGALIFRTIFISIGAVLMQYHVVILIFGIFLIFTGIRILFETEKEVHPDKNPIIKLLKKIFPVTSNLEGNHFFVRKNKVLYMTPLMVCLVFLEVSDIIFAVDSVPAIFAITREPLIVFTSNIFAILGLRALFFLLASVIDKFSLLKYGLGIILIFVGLKMTWLNNFYGGQFPTSLSLIIILGILTVSIVASLFVKPKEDRKEN
ncbi:MAG: TerC family protein [Melioribacteraceae bacterium]